MDLSMPVMDGLEAYKNDDQQNAEDLAKRLITEIDRSARAYMSAFDPGDS